MVASPGKHILKWVKILTPWLLALLLAAGWGLSAWTPGYLETLIPRLAKEMELPLEDFHIRGAGLFSADIGPVRLGPKEGGLRINNVRLMYSPASLKMGRVNSIQLNGVSLDCSYENGQFALPVLDLLPASKSDATDKTIPALPFDSLDITDSTLHCVIDGKPFSIPFSASISPGDELGFSARLHPRDQTLQLEGKLGPTMDDLALTLNANELQLGALNDLVPFPMIGSVDLAVKANANLSTLQRTTAEIVATITDFAMPESGAEIDAGKPIRLQASIRNQAVDFSLSPIGVTSPHPATLSISQAYASTQSLAATFTLETSGIKLPGQFKADHRDGAWDMSLTTANPDRLTIDTGGRHIRLGGMELDISGTVAPSKVDIIISGNTKSASLQGLPARSGSISFSLPLAWPAPKRHLPGKLRVSNLRYDKYKLGSITAQLRQESMELALGGALYSQLLPDLQVKLSGHASMRSKDASFTFDIPRYALTEHFDPTTLVPAMAGVKFSGNLSVEGGLDIHDGDIQSRMGAFLTGGTISVVPKSGDEKAGTTINGIRLYFESPDLLNFRSSPAQLFAFDSLNAGPVSIGKGVVTFQLEPRGVVLVERLGFDWVGGHVASRAFRIVPGHEEYDVTLFCSELGLSSLLKQLGLAEAKGEAALSGELPVSWKRGKISFNNGFLHSTPGQGGTIQVEAMQDLVSAIPEGTPQRGQLELAQAAIKDFEYKWVRIKADTVGEDLLVRLSVDGKPAGTLPFVYTKEFGGFARVTGDVKGSNFQGLRLDVNFSLPLDRILLYKDIINMIE